MSRVVSTCCSSFGDLADGHFDEAIARRDLAEYRKAGPGVTTRMLRDLLVEAGGIDDVLLEVGAGIGGLTFELLERGVRRGIAVDASSAYLRAAAEEAVRRGRAADVQFVQGDFLNVSSQLPKAPTVVLDRVICCYPFYVPLLEASLRHAGRCFALSYPRDVWYVRRAIAVENGLRWLRGRSFRTFVHPADRVRSVIHHAGFTLAAHRQTRQWSADVYARTVA